MPEPTDLQIAMIQIMHAESFVELAQRNPNDMTWRVENAVACLRLALKSLGESTPEPAKE